MADVWTCGKRRKPTERQKARGWCGSPCGRPAVVIWCRVQGSGGAFYARCQAHARPFAGGDWGLSSKELEDDFQCIPVSEIDVFLAARQVRNALRALADPEGARAEFQQRAKYIDPTKVR